MFNNITFKRLTISGAVAFITVIGSIWAWWSYDRRVTEEQVAQLELLGENTRSRIWSTINSEVDQLKSFTQRIEFTQGEFLEYWQQDAAQLVELDKAILFIEWIDSNMIIRDVVPHDQNADIINLDLRNVNYRINAWRNNTMRDLINVTPWITLIQGGQAFLMDSPVYIDSVFYGTVTAGFDFTHIIDEFFQDNEDYHIHLYDQLGLRFYCSNTDACSSIRPRKNFFFNGLINVNNSQDVWWRIEFYPTPSYFSGGSKWMSLISLALSIFLGITLSVALFFIMKTNAQERNTKAINEILEKEKAKAEDSSRVKSEFLSNMSHEIRTPLNIIQGLIQLLSENNDPQKRKEYLELLTNSSSNLLGLLNNILDMDRIEAGLITFQNVRFQPVKKIQALCDIFTQGFRQKGVELIFETNEDPEMWVMGDEVKFTQIVSNFIHNALKFTNEGYVSISYALEDPIDDEVEVTLRVKDSGIGIPKDRLAQIFERFSQIDSGYKKKYAGTGLGLSINFELVRLLGGEIVVNSEEGRGTEFIVSLFFKGALPPDEASPEEIPITDFKGKKCLIVEDNELNVLVIGKMLESLNFTYKSAADGQLGVDLFDEEEFDVVLMDLHMPVMDGMTAAEIMMKKNNEIPIVMVSANVTKEAIAQAEAIGIEHYLTKPVSKERFIEVMNLVLSFD